MEKLDIIPSIIQLDALQQNVKTHVVRNSNKALGHNQQELSLIGKLVQVASGPVITDCVWSFSHCGYINVV